MKSLVLTDAPPPALRSDDAAQAHVAAGSRRAVSPCCERRALQRGFTLIELLIVLVIIAVLSALILPNVMGRADEARITAAKTDVARLKQALSLYKLDNMRYPTTAQGLQALVERPATQPVPMNWRKPYIDKLPNDPWGHPYQLLSPGVHSEVDVFSFGPDGVLGGEGENADIGSWQK